MTQASRSARLLLILIAVAASAADAPPIADDLLQRSRAKYAALKSYADTGIIVAEFNGGTGPALRERHTFTTYYRAPRQFYFDFKADPKAGGDRVVIWMDGAEVNSWWLATGVHQVYPKGQGFTGFAMATLPTKGSVVQMAALLFPDANLHGPTVDLQKTRLVGSETISGRQCHKIAGEVGLAYGTGTVTSTRPTTVWIDAETLLLRKIFEDTPSGGPRASINRLTTTFEARANPELKPSQFKFSVPAK
jgi:outer membrane lipoprotein-sorting protein